MFAYYIEVKSQQQQQQQQQRVEENLPFIPINEYRDVVEPLQRPRDYHLEYQIDQVYQIFPQVPRYVIREDLSESGRPSTVCVLSMSCGLCILGCPDVVRTGNLDATVLNIADGRLQYEEATSATPPRARSIRARQEEQLAARMSSAERRQAVSTLVGTTTQFMVVGPLHDIVARNSHGCCCC